MILEPRIQNMTLPERVEAACFDAAQIVIDRARATGTRIIESRNGEVVFVCPDDAQAQLNQKKSKRNGE